MDNNNKIWDLVELLNGCRSIGSVMLRERLSGKKPKLLLKILIKKKKKKRRKSTDEKETFSLVSFKDSLTIMALVAHFNSELLLFFFFNKYVAHI